MFPKKYLRFDLRFIDKSLEHAYENSKENYYCLLLKILTMYGLLVGFVGWFMNPLNQKDYTNPIRIISLVIILSTTFVILIISWKRPQACRYLLWIVVLVFFFGFMESSYSYKSENWDHALYLIVGMNKEFMAFTLILAKNSWKITSMVLLVMNLFCALRYTDFGTNYQMKFYPFIQYLLNTLLQSLTSYFLQRYDRDSFYKIKTYECSLSCYKNLITNSFPSAVILIKDEKVLFNNQKTLAILECIDEKEILDKLDSLILEEDSKASMKQESRVILDDDRPMINRNFNETSIKIPQIFNYESNCQKTYLGVLEFIGKKKSLEINLTRIIWEHEMVLMIIISENEIVEKIKDINEKSEYKDKLLATVSHDLRTPLNGVMGMIRMTLDNNQDIQTRKYQIANGKLRVNFETFCLWDLIKDVSKLFKFQTKVKAIGFFKEKLVDGERENTLIRSDQNRIKQVLFNLLGNALKFTVKGSITITLKPWKKVENSISLQELIDIERSKKGFIVSVQDTGIGIKKEEQSSLFKLFGRIHNESTALLNKNGVGLGLAMSQTLIRILNNNQKDGDITVQSEYGKGSCFSFVIFSEDQQEEVSEELYRISFEEKSDQEMFYKFSILEREFVQEWKKKDYPRVSDLIARKKKVLVVDDDQINILVTSSYLKFYGDYEFDIVYDGEEAIQKITKKATESYFYDIILMDCNMPKMSGAEAAKIIDSMIENQGIPSLFMIACTANASLRDYDFGFRNGRFDHITKPFTRDELRRKIEKES